eukprot:5572828-Amphidinium_carterae.1
MTDLYNWVNSADFNGGSFQTLYTLKARWQGHDAKLHPTTPQHCAVWKSQAVHLSLLSSATAKVLQRHLHQKWGLFCFKDGAIDEL